MKKILILLLFISVTANAQYSFYGGVDVRNTFYGGTVNDRGADFQIGIEKEINIPTYLQPKVGVYYESFDRLGFENAGVRMDLMTQTFLKRFRGSFGLELSAIFRRNLGLRTTSSDTFQSYGYNTELHVKITNGWSLGFQFNYRQRSEWGQNFFVGSGFLNLRRNVNL